MARIITAGAEGGHIHVDIGTVNVGSVTVQSTTVDNSSFAYKVSSGAGNAAAFGRFAFTGALGTTYYLRVRVQFGALPSAASAQIISVRTGGGTSLYEVVLTSGGKLRLTANGVQIGSDSAATLTTGVWYLVQLKVKVASGAGDDDSELILDGITVATETGGTRATTAPGVVQIGFPVAGEPGANVDFYYDNIALNDDSGTDEITYPAATGRVVHLLPTADSARTAAWTGGAGGTTGLFEAVNNVPPIGTATETDLTQIEHAGGATGDYDATMQTYTVGGIGGSDSITLVQPLLVHGEDISTGTKLLTFSNVSNPAIAAVANFSAGADVAALGTYPTSWTTTRGTVAYAPSVALGTAPVMRATRPETASRVASVCYMALVVEYVPAAAAPAEMTRPMRIVRAPFSYRAVGRDRVWLPSGTGGVAAPPAESAVTTRVRLVAAPANRGRIAARVRSPFLAGGRRTEVAAPQERTHPALVVAPPLPKRRAAQRVPVFLGKPRRLGDTDARPTDALVAVAPPPRQRFAQRIQPFRPGGAIEAVGVADERTRPARVLVAPPSVARLKWRPPVFLPENPKEPGLAADRPPPPAVVTARAWTRRPADRRQPWLNRRVIETPAAPTTRTFPSTAVRAADAVARLALRLPVRLGQPARRGDTDARTAPVPRLVTAPTARRRLADRRPVFLPAATTEAAAVANDRTRPARIVMAARRRPAPRQPMMLAGARREAPAPPTRTWRATVILARSQPRRAERQQPLLLPPGRRAERAARGPWLVVAPARDKPASDRRPILLPSPRRLGDVDRRTPPSTRILIAPQPIWQQANRGAVWAPYPFRPLFVPPAPIVTFLAGRDAATEDAGRDPGTFAADRGPATVAADRPRVTFAAGRVPSTFASGEPE